MTRATLTRPEPDRPAQHRAGTLSTDARRYVHLPLPDAWTALLDGYRPQDSPAVPVLSARLLETTFNALLRPLDEDQRTLICDRYGHGRTTGMLSAERHVSEVRLARDLNRTRRALQRETLKTLAAPLIAAAQQHGTFRVDKPAGDMMWKTVFGVWRYTQPGTLTTRPLQGHRWALYDPAAHQAYVRAVDARSRRPQVLTLNAFMQQTGCRTPGDLSSDDLAARLSLPTWQTHPAAQLTRNGHVTLRTWSVTNWMTAIATLLAEHGHLSWHYSEMARALGYVHKLTSGPDDQSVASVRAILSNDGQGQFEPAGVRGQWRLKRLGDGHRTNDHAIAAVLAASDRPLTVDQIAAKLQRPVERNTLLATLRRNRGGRFQRHATGVYGLAGRPVP